MSAKTKVKTIKLSKRQRAAMSALSAKSAPRKRVKLPYKPLPVHGYQPQNIDAIAMVNANKESEERLLRMLDGMKNNPQFDQRFLNIARTHFELAYMALNRSIFRPGRVRLPGDAPELT